MQNNKNPDTDSKHNDETEETVLSNDWMIRPCSAYNEEYKGCTQRDARTHQKFVYGEIFDCSTWNEDFKNCNTWKETRDFNAALKVIKNEQARRVKRLAAASGNDVWEYRNKPPEDWMAPLPDNMDRKDKTPQLPVYKCVIM